MDSICMYEYVRYGLGLDLSFVSNKRCKTRSCQRGVVVVVVVVVVVGGGGVIVIDVGVDGGVDVAELSRPKPSSQIVFQFHSVTPLPPRSSTLNTLNHYNHIHIHASNTSFRPHIHTPTPSPGHPPGASVGRRE